MFMDKNYLFTSHKAPWNSYVILKFGKKFFIKIKFLGEYLLNSKRASLLYFSYLFKIAKLIRLYAKILQIS